MWSRDRSRRIRLRDGREVTVRPIGVDDKAGIVAAFERLSADSRYRRFMRRKMAQWAQREKEQKGGGK